MPWPWAILPVIAFMLSTVVWSFDVSSFAFATPCVTLPELDGDEPVDPVDELGHLRRELLEVRGRRVDVGAVGLEDLAQLLRQHEHVVDDPGQPLLAEGPAERLLEVRGDVADVDLDVPRELRDLVEGDRRVALEGRALRRAAARRRGPG